MVEGIVLRLLGQLCPLGDALEVLLAGPDARLLGVLHPHRSRGDLAMEGRQEGAEVSGVLVEIVLAEPAGEPFEVIGAVLLELTGDAAAGQAAMAR